MEKENGQWNRDCTFLNNAIFELYIDTKQGRETLYVKKKMWPLSWQIDCDNGDEHSGLFYCNGQ